MADTMQHVASRFDCWIYYDSVGMVHTAIFKYIGKTRDELRVCCYGFLSSQYTKHILINFV